LHCIVSALRRRCWRFLQRGIVGAHLCGPFFNMPQKMLLILDCCGSCHWSDESCFRDGMAVQTGRSARRCLSCGNGVRYRIHIVCTHHWSLLFPSSAHLFAVFNHLSTYVVSSPHAFQQSRAEILAAYPKIATASTTARGA
jgi:hypothetical protein